MAPAFELIQRLDTSGARAVEPFDIDGTQYLAVAQMSRDIPGQAPHLNAGDSATPMPIYQWQGGQFAVCQLLDVPGGEDAEFFRIGERCFLATASVRTGAGPYELNTHSTIFEWHGSGFEPFQSFRTFAAKQWRHFCVDGRHFLALALGVVLPGAVATAPHQSCVFEWNGAQFVHLQDLPSGWGYNWRHAQVAGRHLLAYADHVAPSRILEFDGKRFQELQMLDGKSGRAFSFFEARGETWLAFANLLHDSELLRWNGQRFEPHQVLCGPGARELTWLAGSPQTGAGAVASTHAGGTLLQANFLLGSRDAPQPMAQSCAYQWRGDRLEATTTFASSGAVDVATFKFAGRNCLAVANCLSPELRFRTDSFVYALPGDPP